jgi:hypothetical protein
MIPAALVGVGWPGLNGATVGVLGAISRGGGVGVSAGSGGADVAGWPPPEASVGSGRTGDARRSGGGSGVARGATATSRATADGVGTPVGRIRGREPTVTIGVAGVAGTVTDLAVALGIDRATSAVAVAVSGTTACWGVPCPRRKRVKSTVPSAHAIPASGTIAGTSRRSLRSRAGTASTACSSARLARIRFMPNEARSAASAAASRAHAGQVARCSART